LRVKTETIEITGLPQGTKEALNRIARENGESLEEYARTVLEAKLLSHKPFREILAPVREEFAKSGMTEEEFDSLVERGREAFHKEKR
jgi:plasmid stability protein